MDAGIRNVVLFCLQGEKEIWTNTSHLRKNHNGHFCWSFLKRAGTKITFLLDIKQFQTMTWVLFTTYYHRENHWFVIFTNFYCSTDHTVCDTFDDIFLEFIHVYILYFKWVFQSELRHWYSPFLIFFPKKKLKQKELLDATLSQHTCGIGTQN